jgi:thiamine pyrophosphate-dependent acetolactate synthase large subunit-like protein
MQQTELVRTSSPTGSKAEYGSDLVVELLAGLGIPYIAMNPGSSYRGIHDSLVNFKTPGSPEMVICCHEEIAVAVAHGYARVTGKPIVAAAHDVVGLYHASMGVFNAWCDRIPMIVIGGTGPMAADNRRAHWDFVHTALVQGNVVRDIVKWDDQPASVAAIPESILRAYRTAVTEPSGPVYLCFDVDLQEAPVKEPITLPDVKRFAPPAPIAPDPQTLQSAADLLSGAQWPVILADAVGRHPEVLPVLEELAAVLGAPVVSAGGRFNIASNHPLNLTAAREEVLSKADVVLALDVFDLAGAAGPGLRPERDDRQFIGATAKVIHISLWDLLQHSLIGDYERLMPVDMPITADTRLALPMLRDACRRSLESDVNSSRRIGERREAIERLQAGIAERRRAATPRGWDDRPISMERVSAELFNAVQALGVPWSFVSGGPRGGGWEITEPEQVAGGNRGAGLGYASGAAVGASLAHRGSGRLCISIIGDGDFLYTPSSLWTASNLRLPLLTIVNNNLSYGNDEVHQEYVARTRGRPTENKGVGLLIDDPATNFAHLARAFNVEGFGPVEDPAEIGAVLARAVETVVKEQRPALVDVRTPRRGG